MEGEKIERICSYPLAANIDGPFYSSFADSTHGYLPSRIALMVNCHYEIPELYALCSLHPDRSLRLTTRHELALYNGERGGTKSDHADYELPDLGQVKIKGKAGTRQMTVMALAGHNGVSHNHNDVGSFIVHRNGEMLLVDPGAPMYTDKTFSSQRYDIIYCSSRGHSVPVINGEEQKEGSRHSGTLKTENLNGKGKKRVVIDMTRAYPRGTVSTLIRTRVVDPARNRLELADDYAFKQRPKSVEEAFITFQTATVARNRKSVQVGSKIKGIVIEAIDTPGRFGAKRLVEESKEGRSVTDVITRITFTPEKLAKAMRLRFTLY